MRFPENHFPRAEWDAYQRRCQERWDRGQATDEDTVDSDDDEKGEDKEEDNIAVALSLPQLLMGHADEGKEVGDEKSNVVVASLMT